MGLREASGTWSLVKESSKFETLVKLQESLVKQESLWIWGKSFTCLGLWCCTVCSKNPYFRLVANRWNRIWRTRPYLYPILITYPQMCIFWVCCKTSKRLEVFCCCCCVLFFKKEIEVLQFPPFLKTRDVSSVSGMSCLDSGLWWVYLGLGPTWLTRCIVVSQVSRSGNWSKMGWLSGSLWRSIPGLDAEKTPWLAGRAGIWA